MDAKNNSVIATRNPKRFILPVLAALGLLLCFWSLSQQTEEEAKADLDNATKRLGTLLATARDTGAEYVKTRRDERQSAQVRLEAESAAAALEIQNIIRNEVTSRERLIVHRDKLIAMRREAELRKQMSLQQEMIENEKNLREQLEEKNKRYEEELKKAAEGKRFFSREKTPENTSAMVPGLVDNSKDNRAEVNCVESLPLPMPPEMQEVESSIKPIKEKQELSENQKLKTAQAATVEFPKIYEGKDWPLQMLENLDQTIRKALPRTGFVSIIDKDGNRIMGWGELPRTPSLSSEAIRTIRIKDEEKELTWSIRMVVCDTAIPNEPDADELAGRLIYNLNMKEAPRDLRGVIYDRNGEPLMFFPRDCPTQEEMPLPSKLGEWQSNKSGLLSTITRLDAPKPLEPCPWKIGLQMRMIDLPAATRMGKIVKKDWMWQIAFGMLAITFIGGLAWSMQRTTGGENRLSGEAKRIRLTKKKETKSENWREDEAKVLLAEIGRRQAEGILNDELIVNKSTSTKLRQCGKPGSLKRLQAEHRGGSSALGARILDNARSPVLRQLVRKVRPKKRSTQDIIPQQLSAQPQPNTREEKNLDRAREEFELLLRQRKAKENA